MHLSIQLNNQYRWVGLGYQRSQTNSSQQPTPGPVELKHQHVPHNIITPLNLNLHRSTTLATPRRPFANAVSTLPTTSSFFFPFFPFFLEEKKLAMPAQ